MDSVHAAHGCCGGEGQHQHHHKMRGGHCCGPHRRFISKAERREALEHYKDQLKKELEGLEERLQEL